jgi:hypothetical protein
MALHADNAGFPDRDFRDPRSTPVTRVFLAKGDSSVLIHIAARKRCAVGVLWDRQRVFRGDLRHAHSGSMLSQCPVSAR